LLIFADGMHACIYVMASMHAYIHIYIETNLWHDFIGLGRAAGGLSLSNYGTLLGNPKRLLQLRDPVPRVRV
jgi:hypothetical protein